MALHLLTAARVRPRPVVTHRVGIGTRLVLVIAAFLLLVGNGAPPREIRVEQIASPDAFPIVDWHLARIAERWPRLKAGFLGLRGPVTDPDRAAVAAYFAAPVADRGPLQPAAESAIERAVTSVLTS